MRLFVDVYSEIRDMGFLSVLRNCLPGFCRNAEYALFRGPGVVTGWSGELAERAYPRLFIIVRDFEFDETSIELPGVTIFIRPFAVRITREWPS